jgi:hypothetical protein
MTGEGVSSAELSVSDRVSGLGGSLDGVRAQNLGLALLPEPRRPCQPCLGVGTVKVVGPNQRSFRSVASTATQRASTRM